MFVETSPSVAEIVAHLKTFFFSISKLDERISEAELSIIRTPTTLTLIFCEPDIFDDIRESWVFFLR